MRRSSFSKVLLIAVILALVACTPVAPEVAAPPAEPQIIEVTKEVEVVREVEVPVEVEVEVQVPVDVEPIRIGVLAPITGAFAGLAEHNVLGVRLALEEVDYMVAGRPVQLFIEDTQINADVAIEKARALVNRDHVHVIIGPLSGGVSLAVKNAASEWPDVTILPNGAANMITMGEIAPNVYRTAFAAGQPMYKLAEWAIDNDITRVVTIGEDYAFPWDQVGGFAYNFCQLGGTIPKDYWTPTGTADYSAIISELASLDVDAVLVTFGGTDAINFVKQMDEFGLIGKVRILGGSSFGDATTLAEVGHLLDGTVSGSLYSGDLDHPEFKDFDARVMERIGKPSALFSENFYVGTKMTIMAIEAIDGNIEDQAAFRAALEEIEMVAPRGKISWDEYHNIVAPMYLNQVKLIDGTWRNSMFAKFDDVGQYYNFDVDELMETLPWGRGNPACP
jgi:branched-chain amino acid transport system substrate-binding protein